MLINGSVKKKDIGAEGNGAERPAGTRGVMPVTAYAIGLLFILLGEKGRFFLQ